MIPRKDVAHTGSSRNAGRHVLACLSYKASYIGRKTKLNRKNCNLEGSTQTYHLRVNRIGEATSTFLFDTFKFRFKDGNNKLIIMIVQRKVDE